MAYVALCSPLFEAGKRIFNDRDVLAMEVARHTISCFPAPLVGVAGLTMTGYS